MDNKSDITKSAEEAPEIVELPENMHLTLSLAVEQLNSAKLNVELKQTVLQSLLNSAVVEFSENGKFRVTGLDVAKKQVSRVRI